VSATRRLAVHAYLSERDQTSFVSAITRLTPRPTLGSERPMRKPVVVAVLSVLTFQAAAAHVVRHSSIPESYRGSWAPGAEPCKERDKSAVVLSANTFVSPEASCAFGTVSETPGPQGPVYSTQLQCFNPTDRTRRKTGSSLIIRPDSMNQISIGPGFGNLTTYQRCPA
jgi:hypothetical protein